MKILAVKATKDGASHRHPLHHLAATDKPDAEGRWPEWPADQFTFRLIRDGEIEEAEQPQAAEKPDGADDKAADVGATKASVPFMITNAQRAQLRERGLTDDQIGLMTPDAVQQELAKPAGAKPLPAPTKTV